MNHDFPYYLLDPVTGRLRFTATGRQVLGRVFARAGSTFDPLKRWHRPAPPPPKSPIKS